jgi:hypothetical protein
MHNQQGNPLPNPVDMADVETAAAGHAVRAIINQ